MKLRLDLVVVDSITAPGKLSLRHQDEWGNHRGLHDALRMAGFQLGQRVALISDEDVTARNASYEEIEIVIEGDAT